MMNFLWYIRTKNENDKYKNEQDEYNRNFVEW
jgi:hypothetical protein